MLLSLFRSVFVPVLVFLLACLCHLSLVFVFLVVLSSLSHLVSSRLVLSCLALSCLVLFGSSWRSSGTVFARLGGRFGSFSVVLGGILALLGCLGVLLGGLGASWGGLGGGLWTQANRSLPNGRPGIGFRLILGAQDDPKTGPRRHPGASRRPKRTPRRSPRRIKIDQKIDLKNDRLPERS